MTTPWWVSVAEAMDPLFARLKTELGHGDHFGWSTGSPAYSYTHGYRSGFPLDGHAMICGCGELLHSTVEVDVPAFQPCWLRGGEGDRRPGA